MNRLQLTEAERCVIVIALNSAPYDCYTDHELQVLDGLLDCIGEAV